MVANPRKKAGPGRIRPLNQPAPVQVQEDEGDAPGTVVLRHKELRVTSIQDVWEVVDEWWRANPIARRYYRVAVEGGTTVTVFRDLISGAWCEQGA